MLPLKAVALQPTPDQISERCEVSELEGGSGDVLPCEGSLTRQRFLL